MNSEIKNVKYYCLSCEKIFEGEKKNEMRCPLCNAREYVRNAEPYVHKSLVSRYNRQREVARKMGHRMQAQKMKLVFEHNLVAAMKKYVPSRDAFFQCLKLAKMNTISQKRELYRALLKHNDIKSESEYGFRFSRESKMRGKK